MSDDIVSLVLLIAYAPLLLMGLLWIVAVALRLAGKPAYLYWLARRTSVPQPEQAKADGAHSTNHA